ncbi:MAG: hypothetical protein QM630_01335 [Microbacterium sp.]
MPLFSAPEAPSAAPTSPPAAPTPDACDDVDLTPDATIPSDVLGACLRAVILERNTYRVVTENAEDFTLIAREGTVNLGGYSVPTSQRFADWGAELAFPQP